MNEPQNSISPLTKWGVIAAVIMLLGFGVSYKVTADEGEGAVGEEFVSEPVDSTDADAVEDGLKTHDLTTEVECFKSCSTKLFSTWETVKGAKVWKDISEAWGTSSTEEEFVSEGVDEEVAPDPELELGNSQKSPG